MCGASHPHSLWRRRTVLNSTPQASERICTLLCCSWIIDPCRFPLDRGECDSRGAIFCSRTGSAANACGTMKQQLRAIAELSGGIVQAERHASPFSPKRASARSPTQAAHAHRLGYSTASRLQYRRARMPRMRWSIALRRSHRRQVSSAHGAGGNGPTLTTPTASP
jgi:hypothetical protein